MRHPTSRGRGALGLLAPIRRLVFRFRLSNTAVPFARVLFPRPAILLPASRIYFRQHVDFPLQPLSSMASMACMKAAKRERIDSNQMLWQLAIDRNVQRKFKARCVEASKTMSEQVEELVRAWLRKRE